MNKLLTIGIPAYNVEKYIEKCISSLVGNEMRDFLEILIINDGSLDNTENIARSFQAKYPESVRVISKENGGWGSGVNLAIKEASGKYFKNLDSDDWVDPAGLKELLLQLQVNDVDLMITPSLIYEEGSKKLNAESFPDKCIYEEILDFDQLCGMIDGFFLMPTMTFRTAILQKQCIQIDHCFYTDMELLSFPLPGIKKVMVQKQPVYVARRGRMEQSTSFHSLKAHIRDIEQVANSILLWYAEQKAKGINSKRNDYYLKIVKYVISAYFRQTFTAQTSEEGLLWKNALKEFKRQWIDGDADLQRRKYYSSLAWVLLKTQFVTYDAIRYIWLKTHS